jgi:hypothetical protein
MTWRGTRHSNTGPSQQFLQNRLLEHHPQQMWSRPPFSAWGQEEKKKDYNTDKVSIQQPQDLTILQDSGPIPGGFDYVRFALAYHSTTPRDRWQGFYQLHG